MEDNQKKGRRGPPPTGKGKLLGVRLQPPMIAALDDWVKEQRIPITRQDAIRFILNSFFNNRDKI